jgi:hypothetical protein
MQKWANEIDIEIAKWGKQSNLAGNYAVKGSTRKQWKQPFPFSLAESYSTHRFIWEKNSVYFQSLDGLVESSSQCETPDKACFECTTPTNIAEYIPQEAMPVHINLWLFRNHPPSNGRPVEVVIKDFEYNKNIEYYY